MNHTISINDLPIEIIIEISKYVNMRNLSLTSHCYHMYYIHGCIYHLNLYGTIMYCNGRIFDNINKKRIYPIFSVDDIEIIEQQNERQQIERYKISTFDIFRKIEKYNPITSYDIFHNIVKNNHNYRNHIVIDKILIHAFKISVSLITKKLHYFYDNDNDILNNNYFTIVNNINFYISIEKRNKDYDFRFEVNMNFLLCGIQFKYGIYNIIFKNNIHVRYDRSIGEFVKCDIF